MLNSDGFQFSIVFSQKISECSSIWNSTQLASSSVTLCSKTIYYLPLPFLGPVLPCSPCGSHIDLEEGEVLFVKDNLL